MPYQPVILKSWPRLVSHFFFVITLSLSHPGFSEEYSYIENVHVKVIPIYNDDFVEIDKIKAKEFKRDFKPYGVNKKGIAVLEENLEEGMLKIKLSEKGDVWVEAFSMDMNRSVKIDCPKNVVSKRTSSEAGVSIGFGNICVENETQ